MLSRSARALAHRRPLSLAARSTPTLLRKSGVASLHSTRQLGASTSGNDAFASSTNSFYIDSMYEEYKKVSRSHPVVVALSSSFILLEMIPKFPFEEEEANPSV